MKKITLLFQTFLITAFTITSCSQADFSNPNDPESKNFLPPDISVLVGDTSIPEEGYTFNNVTMNEESNAVEFTIKNTGKDDLNITSVTLEGTGADQFALFLENMNRIVNGESETKISITFKPLSYGLKSANVVVKCDDPDEGTFSFIVKGNCPNPNINVEIQGGRSSC